MAVGALERIFPLAVRAALDVLGVHVAVVPLERRVARRVAVHAARVHEDLVRLQEGRARGGRVVGALADVAGRRGDDGRRPSRARSETTRRGRSRRPAGSTGSSRFIGFRRRPSAFASAIASSPGTDARGSQAFLRSSGRIGSRRSRLPVAAKIALATAGATGGTPGSPTPPILSVVSTMWTSTAGISFIRRIG